MLRTLKDCGFRDRNDPVIVQCFDDAEVRRLKNDLGCPFRLVQLLGENAWAESGSDYDYLKSAAGLKEIATYADAIGPWIPQLYELTGAGSAPASSGLVEIAHESGLDVHPYTFRIDDLPPGFDSFDDLVRFFADELSVDGLFTDFPDKAYEALTRRSSAQN